MRKALKSGKDRLNNLLNHKNNLKLREQITTSQRRSIIKILDKFPKFRRYWIKQFIEFGVNNLFARATRILKQCEVKKMASMTKYNQFLLYGKVEAEKRFSLYCEKQSNTNTFEYKQKKYGWNKKQFNDYNKSRACTLENLQTRYGILDGLKRWDSYVEIQKSAGCTESYFIEKYGATAGIEKYRAVNKLKKNNLTNYIRKYGENIGKIKYENFIQATSNSYSKSSQLLFWKIYNKLPIYLQRKTYFAELNTEFGKYNKNTDTYKKYDFVISSIKYCIEYNGDHYHANPSIYGAFDVVNKVKGKSFIAEDIWKRDKDKNKLLEDAGFFIRIVWDEDCSNNIDDYVKDILNEIARYK